jgi:predicted RNA-binding protein with PUA-like domain
MQYWLMKNEPDELSIDDLATAPGQRCFWDGVRNFQARNMMRDQMRIGDVVLFYYSSVKVPGVVGLATVDSAAEVDPVQFDPKSHYYDPASKPEKPRWIGVWVKHKETFDAMITLTEIRTHTDELGEFALTRKANRLSVMPVTASQYKIIMGLHPRRESKRAL